MDSYMSAFPELQNIEPEKMKIFFPGVSLTDNPNIVVPFSTPGVL